MRPLFFLLFVSCSLLIVTVSAQDMRQMQRVIEKNHYSPRHVDDAYAALLFEFFINELDKDRMYFTQQDLKTIEPWRSKLDDEIKAGNPLFLKQVTSLYISGLRNAEALVKKISVQPVNLEKAAVFVNKENMPFAADANAYKDRWEKYFTYLVLDELYDMHDLDSVKPGIAAIKKEEPTARKTVVASLEKRFARLLGDTAAIADKVKNLYFNSIANLNDPHTEFFAPETKKAFDESLSSERLMFGFAMTETEEGYTVSGVVPGSPAWNSGGMHVNDKITQVKSSNGTTVQPGKSSDQALNKMLDEEKGQLEITVQSADGKTNTIKLQKELIRNDENFVKGFILSHGGKKTGYIALPSFYQEWDENDAGSSCANDIAKEIVKLKREGIDALLLDLRYNGGGSLQEALDLSGIFIDAGPLCIIKQNEDKSYTLKDPARGTIYDGPLGVMINGQSASASELVAGALQDYNRAVIIGGNSFGKATMQIVLPIDSNFNYKEPPSNYQPDEQKGFVKVTTGKLYRINGNTNQLNGVAPDVRLPDPVEVFEYTERKMPFAIASDTTMKKVAYTPAKSLPVAMLAQQSQERVKHSAYFNAVSNYMSRLKKVNAENSIPLQWEQFVAWQAKSDPGKDFEKELASAYFTITNSNLDNRMLQLDSYQKELNDELKDDILNDPYVEEALRIMEDLIRLMK